VEVNPVVILDTSAIIRLFRGTSREIGRAVMNSKQLIIPLAAYAELLAGIERGGRTAQRERELVEELLSEPGAIVHKPDEATGRLYARIFNQLRQCGRMIPTNDIWIAAETMASGGILYSADRHFEAVALLDWRYCE
jgi:tRNA(fMet)-specific endonuclease VapC